jgi:ribose transport system substrate-binding protein
MCAVLALSMVACGGKEEPAAEAPAATEEAATEEAAAPAEAKDLHFEIIVKSFQSTYWQAAVKGVEQACAEQGVTANCNGPANESDIADQVQMLNDAIAKAPAGIGLAACDTNSVLDSLQKALDAGIPVVCFDTGVADAPAGSVVATVATDNVAAGACAAENMYPVIKDVLAAATTDAKVRVGEVNQDATALNIQQRGLGFINKMIELCAADGIKCTVEGNEFYVNAAEGAVDAAEATVVIEVAVPAQTTVELASAEAQKIMAKDDTVAIFGSNQTTAEGVITANGTLNKLGVDPATSIIGAGFDAGTPQKEAINAGQLIGSVTQSPLMMGYECINTLVAVCNGETVADIPMDGYWYNTENMAADDIAPNLYD